MGTYFMRAKAIYNSSRRVIVILIATNLLTCTTQELSNWCRPDNLTFALGCLNQTCVTEKANYYAQSNSYAQNHSCCNNDSSGEVIPFRQPKNCSVPDLHVTCIKEGRSCLFNISYNTLLSFECDFACPEKLYKLRTNRCIVSIIITPTSILNWCRPDNLTFALGCLNQTCATEKADYYAQNHSCCINNSSGEDIRFLLSNSCSDSCGFDKLEFAQDCLNQDCANAKADSIAQNQSCCITNSSIENFRAIKNCNDSCGFYMWEIAEDCVNQSCANLKADSTALNHSCCFKNSSGEDTGPMQICNGSSLETETTTGIAPYSTTHNVEQMTAMTVITTATSATEALISTSTPSTHEFAESDATHISRTYSITHDSEESTTKTLKTKTISTRGTIMVTAMATTNSPLENITLQIREVLNDDNFLRSKVRRIDDLITSLATNQQNSGDFTTDGVELSVITGKLGNKLSIEYSASSIHLKLAQETENDAIVITVQLQLPKNDTSGTEISNTPLGKISELVIPVENTPVVSVDVFNKTTQDKLLTNVSYSVSVENDKTIQNRVIPSFQHQTKENTTVIRKISYVCRFYDLDADSFLDKGCLLLGFDADKPSCFCNHTTIFAVLLSIESFPVPKSVKVLSFVTESISVVCTFAAIVLLTKVRKVVRNDRTMVQINLSAAILILHLLNLFHDLALRKRETCRMLTVLLHYFFFSSASWMCVEGLTLLMKTSERALKYNSRNQRRYRRMRLAFGWGFPLLYVGLSAIIGFATDTYMDEIQNFGYSKCWLNSNSGVLVGAVIVPVGVIYILNTFIIGKTAVFVYKMSAMSDHFKPTSKRNTYDDTATLNLQHLKASLKGVVVLFPVLGTTYIFSFLTGVGNYEASVTFMFLNVILNGLQGLFIFLVYCVFGTEVREALLRMIYRYKSDHYLSSPKVTTTSGLMHGNSEQITESIL